MILDSLYFTVCIGVVHDCIKLKSTCSVVLVADDGSSACYKVEGEMCCWVAVLRDDCSLCCE